MSTQKVENIESIPENSLCVFGQKFSKGVKYFIGRRRGEQIYIHFTQKKCVIDDSIISYQHVLNLNNRKVK